jgi:hypothetical protein
MFPGLCTLSVFEVMWTTLQSGSVFVFWYGARQAGSRTVTQTVSALLLDNRHLWHNVQGTWQYLTTITHLLNYKIWVLEVSGTLHTLITKVYPFVLHRISVQHMSVPRHVHSPEKPRVCTCSNFSRQRKSVRNSRSSQQCCWRFGVLGCDAASMGE